MYTDPNLILISLNRELDFRKVFFFKINNIGRDPTRALLEKSKKQIRILVYVRQGKSKNK